jgi:hypothetical protein
MARRKLQWRSAVHLIRGSLDLLYRLTAPFLPLLHIFSELARDLLSLPCGGRMSTSTSRPRGEENEGKGPNSRFSLPSSWLM